MSGIYEKNVNNSKIERITGWAKFVAPHVVEVDGVQYTAPHICIATGGYA
jgi:glutathione reductase (NADPH)